MSRRPIPMRTYSRAPSTGCAQRPGFTATKAASAASTKTGEPPPRFPAEEDEPGHECQGKEHRRELGGERQPPQRSRAGERPAPGLRRVEQREEEQARKQEIGVGEVRVSEDAGHEQEGATRREPRRRTGPERSPGRHTTRQHTREQDAQQAIGGDGIHPTVEEDSRERAHLARERRVGNAGPPQRHVSFRMPGEKARLGSPAPTLCAKYANQPASLREDSK